MPNSPEKDEEMTVAIRDPMVRASVQTGTALLERNAMLVRELAAIERQLRERREKKNDD